MKPSIKSSFVLFAFVLLSFSVSAQKLFTRAGEITFHSDAPMEKIEAVNNTVTSVLDTETNKLQFAALIKAFQFEKALMQEHFNENYLESTKFPKATFTGEITAGDVNWEKDGVYEVTVSGELTMHGISQKVESPATLTIKNGKVSATSTFVVAVADYGIEIPKVVAEKIAKEVEIRVKTDFEPLK